MTRTHPPTGKQVQLVQEIKRPLGDVIGVQNAPHGEFIVTARFRTVELESAINKLVAIISYEEGWDREKAERYIRERLGIHAISSTD